MYSLEHLQHHQKIQDTSTLGGSRSESGHGVLARGADLRSTFQLAPPLRYNKPRENQLAMIHPQGIRSHSSQVGPFLASIGAKY